MHELGRVCKTKLAECFQPFLRSARKCKVQYSPNLQTWELESMLNSDFHDSDNVGSNKFLHLPFACLLLSN